MQFFLIDVVAFIVVLGILVFVHEFGHYAVAKLFKVRVEVFSLGFGKRLFGFRRGDTDYRISLLPIGGYVKMSGENPMEDRTGDPAEFMSHPRWQRFLIAIAGPAMNIILAVVVLTGVYMVHYEPPPPADVGWVQPNSAAAKAGIQPGDRILKIQNVEAPNWEQVEERIVVNPDQPVDVTVRRGDQTIDARVTPVATGSDRVGDAGWEPPEATVVGDVDPDLPAAHVGIKTGDTITALNGKPVRSIQQLSSLLQEAKSTPVQVGVLRDGKNLEFTMTPELSDIGAGQKKYRIGVAPSVRRVVEKLPFQAALTVSYAECKRNSLLIFELVHKMLQGRNSIKNMSGPVGIARITGKAAMTMSWPLMLRLMALISLNLAVFNLFPIPILDGGLMLMLLIEGIMRRDIKQEVKERVYQAAFVFLIVFAAVVIFNDVAKSFHF
jgi:regulator of sigma E protease